MFTKHVRVLMLLKNIKMYKTILLITLVCFCFLTSCRSKRQETQKVETTIQTDREKIVHYKDTILFTPKSETSLKIPVKDVVFKPHLNAVQTTKTYTQTNGNATAKIQIVRDTILVSATCDSLAIVAKIKREFEREYQLKQKADEAIKETDSGFSFWNLLIAFIFGFFLAYLLKTFKIL